jgi:PIN domain nuclease of toxin-antitoxin system
LLDTGVALIAMQSPERLSPAVRTAIDDGPVFLSTIAYWEVVIKSMKGMLDVGDPRRWWTDTLAALEAQPLLYRPEHVSALLNLPPLHQDPFDRALMAQAIAEDLTLLTTDDMLPRYSGEHLQVLR